MFLDVYIHTFPQPFEAHPFSFENFLAKSAVALAKGVGKGLESQHLDPPPTLEVVIPLCEIFKTQIGNHCSLLIAGSQRPDAICRGSFDGRREEDGGMAGVRPPWDLAPATGWPLGWDPELAKNNTPCPAALTVATPFETIYMGLWSYNCVLSCIAIGGMFYALTWQTHLLALVCGGYLGKAVSHATLLFLPFLPTWLCETCGAH